MSFWLKALSRSFQDCICTHTFKQAITHDDPAFYAQAHIQHTQFDAEGKPMNFLYLLMMHQLSKQPFNLIHTEQEIRCIPKKRKRIRKRLMERNKERGLCDNLCAFPLKEGKYITWLHSKFKDVKFFDPLSFSFTLHKFSSCLPQRPNSQIHMNWPVLGSSYSLLYLYLITTVTHCPLCWMFGDHVSLLMHK